MSKFLTKLINDPKYNRTMHMNIKFNFLSMDCGNGYKQGLKHKFESNDKSDITLLLDIIKRFRFGTKITNITDYSFEFESHNVTTQIFLFRICRYTRRANIKKVLEDTIKINKKRVGIANAFLLAHYYNYKNTLHNSIEYYNVGMDGFYDNTSTSNIVILNKPFKNLKDLKIVLNKDIITYNSIYVFNQVSTLTKKTVMDLLKKDDFKAAEKYLLHIFKL